MKTRASLFTLGALCVTLAACGGANSEAEIDENASVEEPVDKALESVTDEPVEDEEVEVTPPPPAVSTQAAKSAANEAERDFEDLSAALEEIDDQAEDDAPPEVQEIIEETVETVENPGG